MRAVVTLVRNKADRRWYVVVLKQHDSEERFSKIRVRAKQWLISRNGHLTPNLAREAVKEHGLYKLLAECGVTTIVESYTKHHMWDGFSDLEIDRWLSIPKEKNLTMKESVGQPVMEENAEPK